MASATQTKFPQTLRKHEFPKREGKVRAALVLRQLGPNKFVTHYQDLDYAAQRGDSSSYFWGNYFEDTPDALAQAETDYNKRLAKGY